MHMKIMSIPNKHFFFIIILTEEVYNFESTNEMLPIARDDNVTKITQPNSGNCLIFVGLL